MLLVGFKNSTKQVWNKEHQAEYTGITLGHCPQRHYRHTSTGHPYSTPCGLFGSTVAGPIWDLVLGPAGTKCFPAVCDVGPTGCSKADFVLHVGGGLLEMRVRWEWSLPGISAGCLDTDLQICHGRSGFGQA